MSSPVIPFSGKHTEKNSEEEAVRVAAQELVDKLAAEPVPEQLIALARELGRALDEKQAVHTDRTVDPSA